MWHGMVRGMTLYCCQNPKEIVRVNHFPSFAFNTFEKSSYALHLTFLNNFLHSVCVCVCVCRCVCVCVEKSQGSVLSICCSLRLNTADFAEGETDNLLTLLHTGDQQWSAHINTHS